MTDTELVEALARRLREVIKDIEGIAGLSDYEDTCDLAQASEVLRQMHWAYREGCADENAYADSTEAPPGLDELAPDDWQG